MANNDFLLGENPSPKMFAFYTVCFFVFFGTLLGVLKHKVEIETKYKDIQRTYKSSSISELKQIETYYWNVYGFNSPQREAITDLKKIKEKQAELEATKHLIKID